MPGRERGPGPREAASPPGAGPLGAAVTIEQLTDNPHPVLAGLRAAEPAAWLPVLGGWLVTRRDLAEEVLRDADTFTVDDPRFTTARVTGPSMLSLDGPQHRRHRDPFARALRRRDVSSGLAEFTAAQADRLVAALAPDGAAELRRTLAGPLAVAVMAQVLGLGDTDPAVLLAWYDAIVSGVSALTEEPGGPVPPGAAAAFGELRASLEAVIQEPGGASLLAVAARTAGLSTAEVVSNAAVMLFGGIETTEGMISNAILHLLGGPLARGGAVASSPARRSGDRGRSPLDEVRADRSLLTGAIDESLRLEPAAAVVDRFATAAVSLGPAQIRAGDLVVVSLAGANRDPAAFPEPDSFDIRRVNARQNLGFALGPHFCVGAQLARTETEAAINALLDRLPGLRLDPARPARPRGLVFRKPAGLHVIWDEPVSPRDSSAGPRRR
ncbi:MAG TPA: cytochrome P450 [Streptosporangiaceae bacterium]|nr:cytochrome P450 [Streptosporangiaceae bacterium]